MVLRFLSTYEGVEIKTDGEPSIVKIARRVQARRDKTTTLAQTSVRGHQEIGAVERANGTVHAQLRAYYLDVQERMKVRAIPGTQLFPWMLRHSVWTVVRSSPIGERNRLRKREQEVAGTSQRWYHLERWSWGRSDADKMSRQVGQCLGQSGLGRPCGQTNEHLVLTTKGCIRWRQPSESLC